MPWPSLSRDAENTEFHLKEVVTDHYSFYYSCCPEPYPLITFTLKIQRQVLTYFAGIVLPLVLATMAGFLAFITNPHAGERIGLGISVMLVTGVLYLVAVDVLPKSGHWNIISKLCAFVRAW